jgi:tRNA pseudouridine55 synthase
MTERPPSEGRIAIRPTGGDPQPGIDADATAARPSPASGHPRGEDGFLLLDKPPGMSSFQALRPVKRLFHGRKVGHAGTLDPGASGLLLVGVGAGTRLLEHLEGMIKTYSFEARFGFTSDSYDMDGEVKPWNSDGAPAEPPTASQVQAALHPFRGAILQTPPAYSAVKIQGKRACDRVREGETVVLAAREVFVHALEMTSFQDAGETGSGPVASFLLTCSKGTYVRSLVHDLGLALGCGAVTDKIRRLAIGPFRVSDASAPDALDAAPLLPLDTAVQHLPAARLIPARVGPFLSGLPSSPAGYSLDAASAPGETRAAQAYRVLDPEGHLLALGEIDAEGLLRPKKVLARA